jgi:outer membrane protein insertion porin family
VIEGNDRVDAATILSYAGISRGEEVSAAVLNDAYQRIANSGLFETVELMPQGSTLLIRVQEYPIVNVINIEGNKRLKDEQLAELIQSASRRVYSPSLAESDAAAIAEAYRVAGRMAATVTPKMIRRRRQPRRPGVRDHRRPRGRERASVLRRQPRLQRPPSAAGAGNQAGRSAAHLIQRDTYVAERLDLDKKVLTDFYLSRGFIDFQVLDASAEVARAGRDLRRLHRP